ncbi:MAG: hypothetical protein LBQ60_07590, partial [Bacteroidales bacterium]|nr:hypothetical protein [Bacteroidales bacterium]
MDSPDHTQMDHLLFENRERIKELTCINQTIRILNTTYPVDVMLQQICDILPAGWQYNEHTVARIRYGELEFVSSGFIETGWRQTQSFTTIKGGQGSVEVFYTQEFPVIDEGPFLKEKRNLIDNITMIISNRLNNIELDEMALKRDENEQSGEDQEPEEAPLSHIDSRQLLQRFLANQNTTINTLHELMPFKVNEILMVATLYDTFSIENEGKFIEHILGEHYQNNIISMPRITGVTSIEEAKRQLQLIRFDMVIIMGGSDREMPFQISKIIREKNPVLPIFLLTNHSADLAYYKERIVKYPTIDKIFIWSGNTKIFYVMVKYLEDRMNVDNDTQVGLIKVILLVEDSEIYYSRYLPLLYSSVQEQTRKLVEEVHADNMIKVLRARLRPKVILVSDYEEAMKMVHKYGDNLMCLITDVEFPKDGVLVHEAGFLLADEVREVVSDLPIVVQSANREIAHKAFEIKATFIAKDSDSLLQEIRSFINHQMGFGNFVYRDGTGKKIIS